MGSAILSFEKSIDVLIYCLIKIINAALFQGIFRVHRLTKKRV